jgi:hypothetical protein
MRRIEAQQRNARALRFRHSQSLASLRQRQSAGRKEGLTATRNKLQLCSSATPRKWAGISRNGGRIEVGIGGRLRRNLHRRTHALVSHLGDPPGHIDLPGLIFLRRHAEMRANRFRGREPGWIINGRNISQPHNGTNARRRHQKPRAGIAPRQFAHLVLETMIGRSPGRVRAYFKDPRVKYAA